MLVHPFIGCYSFISDSYNYLGLNHNHLRLRHLNGNISSNEHLLVRQHLTPEMPPAREGCRRWEGRAEWNENKDGECNVYI